jgi:hypothetical protein
MKAWLKGGLIGAAAVMIINLLYYPIRSIFRNDIGLCKACELYSSITQFFYWPTNLFICGNLKCEVGEAGLLLGLFGIPITLIFWFLVGVIMAFIISKIKSKK